MNKTLSVILNIISAALSVVLSVALLFSLIGATLIGVGRAYLTSEEFNSQIDNTELSLLTFTQKGEKITLGEYTREFAEEYVENYIEENTKASSFPFKDLFSLGNFSITDYAVDMFLNSETIDKAIKTEVHSIIDYFLYNDPAEARERLNNGITLQNNPELNLGNAETFDEEISIKIKLFVLEFVEDITGISCDKIIILLSEETAIKLKNISIGLAIAIIVVNVRRIFNALGYLGAVSLTYSEIITLIQNKFEEFHQGKQELVSYEFLKPLLDTYTPYADRALTYGLVLLSIFFLATVIIILIKKRRK